jgi:hypothetical protein
VLERDVAPAPVCPHAPYRRLGIWACPRLPDAASSRGQEHSEAPRSHPLPRVASSLAGRPCRQGPPVPSLSRCPSCVRRAARGLDPVPPFTLPGVASRPHNRYKRGTAGRPRAPAVPRLSRSAGAIEGSRGEPRVPAGCTPNRDTPPPPLHLL